VRKKSKGQEGDQTLAPDHGSRQKWARLANMEVETLINAKTVIGYCGDVKSQLRSRSRLEQFQKFKFSMAPNEKPPLELSIESFVVGFNKVGTIAANMKLT
jgi:hypothetical protein